MAGMREMMALLTTDYVGVIGSLGDVASNVRAEYFWHFRPFDHACTSPKIHSNFPPDFTDAYLDRKCQKFDPVVVETMGSNILTWWDSERLNSRDPIAEKIVNDRFAQGCSIGISLPVRGKGGQFSIFSLWSSDRDGFRDAVADGFDTLHAYALYLHEALFRQRRGQDAHGLTDTEQELLRWTALGKTAWEISVLVSLPERTVHYHLAEASRKLGAPNKTAAVCIALKAGLLDV